MPCIEIPPSLRNLSSFSAISHLLLSAGSGFRLLSSPCWDLYLLSATWDTVVGLLISWARDTMASDYLISALTGTTSLFFHHYTHLYGPTQMSISELWVYAGSSIQSCISQTPWTPWTSHPWALALGTILEINTTSRESWHRSSPWTKRPWTIIQNHIGQLHTPCISFVALLHPLVPFFIHVCGTVRKLGMAWRWAGSTKETATMIHILSWWNIYLGSSIGGMHCFLRFVRPYRSDSYTVPECNYHGGK